MDIAKLKEVIAYKDGNGKKTFEEWFNSLRDHTGSRRILRRIRKLESGIYGDRKSVGEGVSELRMFFSPGYRVYIGEHGDKIVLLLGGDKDSQPEDVKQAKDYWSEYKKHEKLM